MSDTDSNSDADPYIVSQSYTDPITDTHHVSESHGNPNEFSVAYSDAFGNVYTHTGTFSTAVAKYDFSTDSFTIEFNTLEHFVLEVPNNGPLGGNRSKS